MKTTEMEENDCIFPETDEEIIIRILREREDEIENDNLPGANDL
jgi:hypothetical protein